MARKGVDYPEIETAVKTLLKEASCFEERKLAIDTAMKFEGLKLKAKGNDFGKGFDDTGGDEDDGP